MCDNDSFKSLLACLRVIVSNKTEFECIVPDKANGNSMRGLTGGITYHRNPLREASYPISTTNEIKVLYLLKSICEDYLSKYTHTYNEDKNSLLELEADPTDNITATTDIDPESESDTVSEPIYMLKPYSNHRNAVIQIAGEKEVLHFYIHFCEVGLKLLHLRSNSGSNSGSSSNRGNNNDNINSDVKISSVLDSDTTTRSVFQQINMIQKEDNELELELDIKTNSGITNSNNMKRDDKEVNDTVVTVGSELGSGLSSDIEVGMEMEMDLFSRLDMKLDFIRKVESNSMIYNYCKNHIYQIRLQDDRKCTMMKRSLDYTKPTTV